MMVKRLTCLVFVVCVCVRPARGQVIESPVEPRASSQDSSQGNPVSVDGQEAASSTSEQAELAPKRIFGIIPNYRTALSLKDYRPLTPRQKFKIATQDSFDRGTIILGVLFGGQGELTNSTPSFGHGASSYARYFAWSYTDFVTGNYMTEAVYPTLLHQDPRYFRSGTGSTRSRLGYAMGQIFWTHTDSARMQFNFSEIVGNSTAVALSNLYYPDNRSALDAVTKLGIQIGIDMAGNVLKEFSPELNRAFSRKHGETRTQ